ncbi:MAG: ABC transporter substrate-binding protein [Rhodospirillaceae bacterium]|nr:MAG: ABC transporter substrate-binding protein [Rhodospirillaceae bacterium]
MFAATVCAPVHAEVHRVISLNPCLDTILVDVADRDQIAALSHYAREPHDSSVAAVAAALPIVYETAEEVIALHPDLVLAGRHNALATRNALDRLGVRTALFDVPESVADSIAQVKDVARLVDRVDRGNEVVARIEAALDEAKAPPGARAPTALIFQPNGLAPGAGTLANEMLQRTGFINVADRYGLRKWQNVALEQVIADPPEVLLSGEPYPGAPTWAERIMSHPALKHLAGRMVQATFPERLLYCGGPVLIETAAALASARIHAAEILP